MAASSPVTISHGRVNRRRTGSARRTAIDPANAAFIGSVLLLARYYRLIGWVARSSFFADCRRVECTPDAPAMFTGSHPGSAGARLPDQARQKGFSTSQAMSLHERPTSCRSRSVHRRVPDGPGSAAARCVGSRLGGAARYAGSRLGGSKFPEHDDLSSGAWTFLAPKNEC